MTEDIIRKDSLDDDIGTVQDTKDREPTIFPHLGDITGQQLEEDKESSIIVADIDNLSSKALVEVSKPTLELHHLGDITRQESDEEKESTVVVTNLEDVTKEFDSKLTSVIPKLGDITAGNVDEIKRIANLMPHLGDITREESDEEQEPSVVMPNLGDITRDDSVEDDDIGNFLSIIIL